MTKVTITRRPQPPQQGGGDVFLFSKEDGMLFAMVAADTAYWGEDPTKRQTRCFISLDTAMQFAKGKCKEMLGRDDLDFIMANEEMLVQPVRGMPPNMHRKN
jgi:hypothetical protein